MVQQKKTKKKSDKKHKKPAHENTRPSDPLKYEGLPSSKKSICSLKNFITVLVVLLAILMVNLYFFVDSPKPTVQKTKAPPKPKTPPRAPKKPTWMATEEVDMKKLQELIQELEDRVLVVAFEEAQAEGSRKQYWKRWERIARAIPNKKQFKRYDEDELPMIVRFDCSNEHGKACEQLIGQNLPAALMWKSQIPRMFPSGEVRTDTQVYNYLSKHMQEAVKYAETLEDAEYFVTDEGISLMYFGKDEKGVYKQVADAMRDHFNFGRTNDASIAEAFEAEVPSLRMYRSFDESPLMFTGNITDVNQMSSFVRDNSVPLFGEWKGSLMKNYQNRKLPLIFIAVDPTEDETENVLEVSKTLAKEYWGEYSFTQLDAIMNADVASQMKVTELPEVLILTGTEMRKKIDLDNVEQSIRDAIAEWKEASEKGADDGADLDDEYEDDYDEEYEEGYDDLDQEDFDGSEETADAATEEQETEEL